MCGDDLHNGADVPVRCDGCECVDWNDRRILACDECDTLGNENYVCCAMTCPFRKSEEE